MSNPKKLGAEAAVYLSEVEVTARYGLPHQVLVRLRATGGGPEYTRIGTRLVRYKVSSVEAWMAARTFKHHADELNAGRELPRGAPKKDAA